MTPPSVRPIRYRVKLTPDEKLVALKNAASQYRLGFVMVLINLIFPPSSEAFGFYFLPIIVMFVLAWVISFTRRLLWPRDATQDGGLATVLACAGIFLCLYRHDLIFSHRLLGDWHVVNVFAKSFTIFHLAALIVAAFLIPRNDCWSPLRIAAMLTGTCIIGEGMPDGKAVVPLREVWYLGLVSSACFLLVNLDVAICIRAWYASSPTVSLKHSDEILSRHPFANWFLWPFYFLFNISAFSSAVWRSQVLWLTDWPAPPESLTPGLLELSHLAPLRRPGVRHLMGSTVSSFDLRPRARRPSAREVRQSVSRLCRRAARSAALPVPCPRILFRSVSIRRGQAGPTGPEGNPMSPGLDPEIFPAIFEAHVGAHRRRIDELRAEAARRGQPFDPDEHEQIFLGIRQDNMQPAWVPRRSFLEHGLIIGPPGSGKTSLIAGILAQLHPVAVDLGRRRGQQDGARADPRCSRGMLLRQAAVSLADEPHGA